MSKKRLFISFQLLFIFIILMSLSCAGNPKDIRFNDIFTEIPPVKIKASEETTLVVHGESLAAEGSYYLTSFDPDSMKKGKISLHTIHGIDSMAQQGDYIYFASRYREHTFMVLNVSDIEHPKVVFTYDGNECATTIKISENYLFLVTSKEDSKGYSLLIFDIKDPSSPKFIKRYDSLFFNKEKPFYISDLFLADNLLYIVADDSFVCMDLENKQDLKVISRLNIPQLRLRGHIIGFKNKKLIIADYMPKFYVKHSSHAKNEYIKIVVIDVKDPKNPKIFDFSEKLRNDTNFKNIKSKKEGAFPVFNATFLGNKLLIHISFLVRPHLFRMMFTENDWTGENDLLIAYDLSDDGELKYINTYELSGECEIITSIDNYIAAISKNLKVDYFKVDELNQLIKIPENEVPNIGFSNKKLFLPQTFKESEDGITLFNFINPGTINLRNIFPTSGDISQIKIKDNIAYIADSEQGLVLVNVSDPLKPVIVNEFKTLKHADRFFIDQNVLFLVDQEFGIRSIDIKDYKNLKETGKIEIKDEILDLTAIKDQIFILTKNGIEIFKYNQGRIEKTGIKIPISGRFNCINSYKDKIYIPAINEERTELILYEYVFADQEKQLNSYSIKKYSGKDILNDPLNIWDFAIDEKNGRSFIATDKTIEIITFNPSPVYLDNIIPEGHYVSIDSVVYENGKVYIGVDNDIQIFGEKYGHLEQILNYLSDGGKIAVNEGVLYKEAQFSKLQIIIPEYKKDPEFVTVLKNQTYLPVHAIGLKEKYLMSLGLGLDIFDIGDNFKHISKIEKIYGKEVLPSGDLLYIIDDYEFKILDIKDINSPKIISKYNNKDWRISSGITKDNFIYLGINEGSENKRISACEIIDASDPVKPVLISKYQTDGEVIDIQIKNDLAFIFEKSDKNCLEIINVSDKKNPFLVSQYNGKLFWNGIKIILKDDIAYLVQEESIHIIDIKNPSSPKLIKEVKVDFHIKDAKVNGDYIYIAAIGSSHFITFNIEDPSGPYIINKRRTPGFAENIYVDEKYVYVIDSRLGTMVFCKPVKIKNAVNIDPKTVKLNLPEGLPEGKFSLKYFSREGAMQKINDIIVE